MRYMIWCISLAFFFTSCEREINIQPQIQQPLLVVDGQIENDRPPVIQLSRSISYFSTISLQVLAESFVHNAVVILTDGTTTHQLKEYAMPVGAYNIYFYSTDSSQSSTAIIGEFGKKYRLQIETEGKQYIAETNIPLLSKTIDSLWWMQSPRNTDTSKVVLMVKATDPPGYGNYIRYFTRANSESFQPGANSAFDDQVVDGKTYDIQVDRGINRNDPPGQDDYGYFKRGDTATIKFYNIDKATFDFWRTLEFGYQSVGNPFSSPTKVLGNVNNGALGAFCGYAVQYKSIIIPK